MKDLSHPAALQILKKAEVNVKIVIFRDKDIDFKLEEESRAKEERMGSTQVEIQLDSSDKSSLVSRRSSVAPEMIPGSVLGDLKAHHNNRPPLIRHSTVSSLSSDATSYGIPHLEENGDPLARVRKLNLTQLDRLDTLKETEEQRLRSLSFSSQRKTYSLTEQSHKPRGQSSLDDKPLSGFTDTIPPPLEIGFTDSAPLSEAPCDTSRNLASNRRRDSSNTLGSKQDDDDSDYNDDFEPPRINTSLLVFGERSESHPFVIEYQKMLRGLRINVMLDEEDVLITETLPSGLVAKEGSIR